MSLDREAWFFAAFAINVLLATAVFIGLSLFEWHVLNERPLAESLPPHITTYHISRSGVALVLSFAIIADLYRRQDPASPYQRGVVTNQKLLMAWGAFTSAVAFTALFVLAPALFNKVGEEDGLIEWCSAALPWISSALLIYGFRRAQLAQERNLRRTLALFLTALGAFVLFVLGMEEISWTQRVFNIETPAMFEGNWQNEMNLHNMSSRSIAAVLMLASFVWLILLPFVYEMGPRTKSLETISDFIPSRFVAAISAPMAAFNYSTWNFFPTQMTMMMATLIMLFYARAAWQRREPNEAVLFAALAAFIVSAQAIFLLLGAGFVRLWDVTEYLEFYVVLGFICFAWETAKRLHIRYAVPGRNSKSEKSLTMIRNDRGT